MADSGNLFVGEEEVEGVPWPSVLWEDSLTRFENLVDSKKFNQNSDYVKVAKQIRGTYIIIINYFHTFPEFDTSTEALNLTFNCMDGLEQIEAENKNDSTYFRALLAGIKEMSILVNTSCFVTHDSMNVKAKKDQDFITDPPLPKKKQKVKPTPIQAIEKGSCCASSHYTK